MLALAEYLLHPACMSVADVVLLVIFGPVALGLAWGALMLLLMPFTMLGQAIKGRRR